MIESHLPMPIRLGHHIRHLISPLSAQSVIFLSPAPQQDRIILHDGRIRKPFLSTALNLSNLKRIEMKKFQTPVLRPLRPFLIPVNLPIRSS